MPRVSYQTLESLTELCASRRQPFSSFCRPLKHQTKIGQVSLSSPGSVYPEERLDERQMYEHGIFRNANAAILSPAGDSSVPLAPSARSCERTCEERCQKVVIPRLHFEKSSENPLTAVTCITELNNFSKFYQVHWYA